MITNDLIESTLDLYLREAQRAGILPRMPVNAIQYTRGSVAYKRSWSLYYRDENNSLVDITGILHGIDLKGVYKNSEFYTILITATATLAAVNSIRRKV